MIKIGLEIESQIAQTSGYYPASHTIGYDKENPYLLDGFGTIHEDGANIEFAIDPTYTGEQQWAMYEELLQAYTGLCDPTRRDLVQRSSTMYPTSLLRAHRANNYMGCSPSRHLIYADTPPAYVDNRRYAGVHVNLDFEGDKQDKERMVRLLDYRLGLHSVLNWEEHHNQNEVIRRRFYGQAGEHRLTPFGIEYRTLGASIWNEKNVHSIYDIVDKAAADFISVDHDKLENKYYMIAVAINQSDVDLAKTILEGVAL